MKNKIIDEDNLYEIKAYVSQQEEIKSILKSAEQEGVLDNNKFATLITDLLVSPTGYIIDTGGTQMANAEIALLLAEKIKKHPKLWRIFMVA